MAIKRRIITTKRMSTSMLLAPDPTLLTPEPIIPARRGPSGRDGSGMAACAFPLT